MSSSSSSDDSDEDIILQILINLPRPRRFKDRSNPLQDYDDLDFKCRFRLEFFYVCCFHSADFNSF